MPRSLIIMFFVFFLMGSILLAQEEKHTRPKKVTVCDLLKEPDRYHRQPVTLQAEILEGETMIAREGNCPGAIIVLLPEDGTPLSDKLHKDRTYRKFLSYFNEPDHGGAEKEAPSYAVSATIFGVFDAHPVGYGSDAHAVLLTAIRKVIPISVPRGSMIPESKM